MSARSSRSLVSTLVVALVVSVLVVAGPTQAQALPGDDDVIFEPIVLADGAMVALDPVRLLETRIGANEQTIDRLFEGEGAVDAGVVKRVQIAGRGGVPDGALAAVLNVTVVRPDAETFVTVFPCGDLPLASSLNAPAGGTAANEVVAKLSASGEVCLYSLAKADFVMDVTGYVPAGSAAGFVSLDPARLLETRVGVTERTTDRLFEGEGAVGAGMVKRVQVAGRGDVPADAVAAVLNVTVVMPPDAETFVTVFPCGDLPLASSLNALVGETKANEVIAKLSESGEVCLFASRQADLVMDVTGFVPAGSITGLVSLDPARLLETRVAESERTIDRLFEGEGAVAAGVVKRVQVAGRGDVPADALAAVLNVTVVRPDAETFVTVFPCGGLPLASSLNSPAGGTVPNEVIAKLSESGEVCLFTSATADFVIDVTGYVPFVAPVDPPVDPPPVEGAIVPDVVGLQQGEAMNRIGAASLRSASGGAEHNPAPAGQVLRQTPVPGTEVAVGSVVPFVVSLGPVLAEIPDVLGLTEGVAVERIESAGFTVGDIGEGQSDEYDVDDVNRQLPLGGQQALPGTPVDIVVTTGTVNDPPVIGSDPVTTHTTGSGGYVYDVDATDPDGDTVTYTLQAGPTDAAGGLVAEIDAVSGVVTWNPTSDDAGAQDFAVRASDGRGGIDVQSFTVVVEVPNQTPDAVDDLYGVDIDDVLVVDVVAGVLANDTDPDDDVLSVAQVVTGPSNGRLELGDDGSFSYTPFQPGGSGTSYTDIDLTRFSLAEVQASPVQFGFVPTNLVDGYRETFWVSDGSEGTDGQIILSFDSPVAPTTLELFGVRGFNADSFLGLREIDVQLLDVDGSVILSLPGQAFPPNAAGDQQDADLVIDLAALAGGTAPAGVHTVVIDVAQTDGGRPGLAEVVLTGEGPARNLSPDIQWSWTDDSGRNIGAGMASPTVGDLDGDGFPEVLFHAAGPTSGGSATSTLYALDGRDGSVKWEADQRFQTISSPVIGDLDNDGLLEVIAVGPNLGQVVVLDHLGQERARYLPASGGVFSNVALADLDGDGVPEIVVPIAGQVAALDVEVDAAGTMTLSERWRTTGSGGCGGQRGTFWCVPIVADIDLDGEPEIVMGNRVVDADGLLEHSNIALTDGFVATGNFDDDARAEIVHVANGQIRLLDEDLSVVWGPVPVPRGGVGGPPTVGDFDSDGQPEIGVAGASAYVVLDTDGTELWQARTIDGSSNFTGSTIFDFDDDGTTEVVYRDEQHLWIYDGPTGEVRYRTPMGSLTLIEYPIVADIDADGQAEIVVPQDIDVRLPDGATRQNGLYAFGAALNNWVRARPIWNQHSYHVSNVNADGSIPAVESPNWLDPQLNNYRENTFPQDEVAGLDRFTYRVTDGTDVDEAVAYIDIRDPENAPQITCQLTPTAVVGFTYSSRVCAIDPDVGDTLTYAIDSGLSIDPGSGIVTWSPSSADLGDRLVSVTVTDSTGRTAVSAVTVTVVEPVIVPDVVGTGQDDAETAVVDAGLTVGDVDVVADRDVPAGDVVSQIPVGGTWAAPGADVDLVVSSGPAPGDQDADGDGVSPNEGDCDDTDDTVSPGADDVRDDGVDSDCDGNDGVPRVLTGLDVSPTTTVIRVGETFAVSARAVFDDGATADVTTLGSWTSQDPGVVRFDSRGRVVGIAAGSGTVRVTYLGIRSDVTVTVRAPAPVDMTPPTIAITQPAGGSTVTAATDVVGTASDANLASYEAVLLDSGGVSVQDLGAGTTSVVDGVLGSLDPSGLADGVYTIRLTASDFAGNRITGELLIRLGTPVVGVPVLDGILLNPVNPQVPVGGDLSMTATAFYTDGSSVVITDNGTWQTGDAAVAAVSDVGLLSGVSPGRTTVTVSFDGQSASRPVVVTAPAAPVDRTPPVASITTPVAGTEVAGPVEVVGSATDADLLRWTLDLVDGGDVVAQVATGTDGVSGDVLGVLDPTMLFSGSFELVLTVVDVTGNRTTARRPVTIAGQLKIGTFALSFTDLVVPAPGLPIEVRRDYDTRDDEIGDFGYGWRLGLSNLRVTSSGTQGEGWALTAGRFSFRLQPSRPHTITIVLPDGTTEEFEATTTPSVTSFIPPSTAVMGYTARPGTRGRLEPTGNRNVLIFGGGGDDVELVDDTTFRTWDPVGFRYTSPDGTRFVVSADGEVRSIADPSGNVITISRGGITHSAGNSVVFERDSLDRITAIIDGAGNRQTYGYDAVGDLVAHTDADGAVTRFRYTGVHDILEVVGAGGVGVRRLDYDDDGRLIRLDDGAGYVLEFEHDVDARREVITDANGHPNVIGYDDQGNVVEQIDAEGRRSAFTYDADGNLLTRDLPGLGTESFTYDARDRVIEVVDPAGGTTMLTYLGTSPQIATVTDALGDVTSFDYDAAGRVLTRSGPSSVAMYSYDSNGMLRTATVDGATSTYEYDSLGNLILEQRPDGSMTSFEVNGAGAVTAVEDEDGRTELAVNGNGLPIRVTTPAGDVTTLTYNAGGLLDGVTTPDGTTVVETFDAGGRPTEVRRNGDVVQSFVYRRDGLIESQTDPAGTTTFDYDDAGRQVLVVDPAGRRTTYGYGLGDQPTTITDAAGGVTRFDYDDAGRTVAITDATGRTEQLNYDAAGNPVRVVDAAGLVTEAVFDAGRPVRITNPGGGARTIDYDASGRPIEIVDEEGGITRTTYDVSGRPITVTDPLGATTTYVYSAGDDLAAVIDPLGRTTRYEHDVAGRVIGVTHPDGSSIAMTRDLAGQVVSSTDPAGRISTYTYTDVGDLASVTRPDGSIEQRTYDAAGNLLTAQLDDQLVEFTRSPTGSILSSTQPGIGSITYVEDAVGRVSEASMTVDGIGSSTTRYGYDLAGRLTSVETPDGLTAIGYDAAGRATSQATPDGTRSIWEYGGDGLIASLQISNSAGVVLDEQVTRDLRGDITRISRPGAAASTFVFDAARQLLSESHDDGSGNVDTFAYGYDAVGNRVAEVGPDGSVALEYDVMDRLVSRDGQARRYDVSGNLIGIADGTAERLFAYDSRDLLIGVTDPAEQISYDVDALGRRSGRDGETYLLDVRSPTGLNEVVATRNADGTTATRTAFANSALSTTGPGGTSFWHSDVLGNAAVVTDEFGAVTDQRSVSAFGTLLSRTGAGPLDRLFESQPIDPFSGLTHLRARDFESQTGLFNSVDPLALSAEDPGARMRYTYGLQNPVAFEDLTGLFATLGEVKVTLAIQGTIGAAFGGIIGYISGTGFLKGAVFGAISGIAGAAAGLGIAAGVATAATRSAGAQIIAKLAELGLLDDAVAVAAGLADAFIGLATDYIATGKAPDGLTVGVTFIASIGLALGFRNTQFADDFAEELAGGYLAVMNVASESASTASRQLGFRLRAFVMEGGIISIDEVLRIGGSFGVDIVATATREAFAFTPRAALVDVVDIGTELIKKLLSLTPTAVDANR